ERAQEASELARPRVRAVEQRGVVGKARAGDRTEHRHASRCVTFAQFSTFPVDFSDTSAASNVESAYFALAPLLLMGLDMSRPITLSPLETKKSWGAEQWLNPAMAGASVKARNQAGTLAELIAANPAMLGDWARRLYGEQLPIFTKFLRADFPPFV